MTSEGRRGYEILKMIQMLQPSTWVPMSSRSITTKALPTARTIAIRLKMQTGQVKQLIRDYEKMGYITVNKRIAEEVAEPAYVTGKRRNKKGGNYPVTVSVYGLTEKGKVKLKYLDDNKDAFSRVWLQKWMHR